MRAAVFREMSKPLVIETVPDPKAGAHDIILKVKNCGICGSDLHMTEPTSAMPLALGSIMGHEFAGEVIEVGSAVKHLWKAGDRLAGFPVICCGDHTPCINFGLRGTCSKMLSVGLGASPGAYAEYVRIGAGSGYKLPANVSFQEGAMVEPLAVGLHAVDMAKMPRGATVLIIGAGPVGLATMLWAKFLGARHVIVSEKAEVRRQMAASRLYRRCRRSPARRRTSSSSALACRGFSTPPCWKRRAAAGSSWPASVSSRIRFCR
jgi:(R,R)-butanediol dehydrogenase/meso-butanediol dehydrogenase/diacetyl reductase